MEKRTSYAPGHQQTAMPRGRSEDRACVGEQPNARRRVCEGEPSSRHLCRRRFPARPCLGERRAEHLCSWPVSMLGVVADEFRRDGDQLANLDPAGYRVADGTAAARRPRRQCSQGNSHSSWCHFAGCSVDPIVRRLVVPRLCAAVQRKDDCNDAQLSHVSLPNISALFILCRPRAIQVAHPAQEGERAPQRWPIELHDAWKRSRR